MDVRHGQGSGDGENHWTRDQGASSAWARAARIECRYRIDLLIDDTVILELKSADELAPVHEAQLLNYMTLARIRTGLPINFNQQRLIDGLRRFKL